VSTREEYGGLSTDTETPMHGRQVSDTLRKEEIEIDDARGAR
jgi:hypothetical protein